jgi:hypothetical protein
MPTLGQFILKTFLFISKSILLSAHACISVQNAATIEKYNSFQGNKNKRRCWSTTFEAPLCRDFLALRALHTHQ